MKCWIKHRNRGRFLGPLFLSPKEYKTVSAAGAEWNKEPSPAAFYVLFVRLASPKRGEKLLGWQTAE